jgi:hypothetical protein
MEKCYGCNDATSMNRRGRYRFLGENLEKKSFIGNITSQTEEHKHNIW